MIYVSRQYKMRTLPLLVADQEGCNNKKSIRPRGCLTIWFKNNNYM